MNHESTLGRLSSAVEAAEFDLSSPILQSMLADKALPLEDVEILPVEVDMAGEEGNGTFALGQN